MPIREYEKPDGSVVEVLHGAQEVEVPKSWKRVLSTASFKLGSVQEPSMSQKVKNGYYKQECEKGSRFRSRYSPNQIKAAWGW